jgi:membrane dipeptidase
MTKTIFTSITLLLLIMTSCKSEISEENQLIAKARAIHKRTITLDTHCDINVKNFTDSINYTQDLDTQVTLPKMDAGGLDVVWFIVYTGQDSLTETGYRKAYNNAMSKFNAIHKLVDEIAPNAIELALNSDDVKRFHANGKKVAMIGVENGYPIGLDISNVEKFHKLGARYMSLSHNGHSQLCDSNTGERDSIWLHNGLSDMGKQVVAEMNRVGMMIDVSHPSKESMRQMIALSKAPIIASHSSARALCNHSRNLDDEQLEWLKANGGVVQTVAFKSYLNTEKFEARDKEISILQKQVMDSMGVPMLERDKISELPDKQRETYYTAYRKMRNIVTKKAKVMTDLPPDVDVSDFVNHIDYLVEKIGIDHVGISSDFDGGGGIKGWSDASETFNVTLELVKRGYSEKQIEQLWSGNLLRVLNEVEAVASEIQSQNPI